jgi:hypothetical protein
MHELHVEEEAILGVLVGRKQAIDLDLLYEYVGKWRNHDFFGTLQSLIRRGLVDEPTQFHYFATDMGEHIFKSVTSYDTERDPLSLVYGEAVRREG